MIQEIPLNRTDSEGRQYREFDANGVNHLMISRAHPFAFKLFGFNYKFAQESKMYVSDDYTREGSASLVEFMKMQALTEVENWSISVLQTIPNIQKIWVGAIDEFQIFLSYVPINNSSVTDPTQYQFYHETEQVNDVGLISLVDAVIAWLQNDNEGIELALGRIGINVNL